MIQGDENATNHTNIYAADSTSGEFKAGVIIDLHYNSSIFNNYDSPMDSSNGNDLITFLYFYIISHIVR